MTSTANDPSLAFPAPPPVREAEICPLPLGSCPACRGELISPARQIRSFRELQIGRARVRVWPATCPYADCAEPLLVVSSGFRRRAMRRDELEAWMQRQEKSDARASVVAFLGIALGNAILAAQAVVLASCADIDSIAIYAFPVATLTVGFSLFVLTVRGARRARRARRRAHEQLLSDPPRALRGCPRSYRAV